MWGTHVAWETNEMEDKNWTNYLLQNITGVSRYIQTVYWYKNTFDER